MGDMTVKELGGYFWNAGLPIFMFALWTYAGFKGWWVYGRELTECAVSRDKWQSIAMSLAGTGKEAVVLAASAIKPSESK